MILLILSGDRTVNFSGGRFNKYQEGEYSSTDHIRSLFDGKKKGIPTLVTLVYLMMTMRVVISCLW